MTKTKAYLVVPFYKHPELASAVCDNLCALREELSELACGALFINDSPDDPSLDSALAEGVSKLAGPGADAMDVQVINNESNLGFVHSTNRGLSVCRQQGTHAVLLNSDVTLAPDCLREMFALLAADPMIGFVNPRSNNATICTLPMSRMHQPAPYEEAFQLWKALHPYLPRWQFSPTGMGFCLLIRSVILQDFGLLDEIYAPGYNEENDLCFRANRAGYRCVMANAAFAYHQLSASFSDERRQALDRRNSEILDSRYPEYRRAVGEYLNSPAVRYEELLLALVKRPRDSLRVLVDLTHVTLLHNGTHEYGKAILRGLREAACPALHLAIMCDEHQKSFHELDSLFPDLEFVPKETTEVFDVAIKPAQPFHFRDLKLLSQRALFNVVVMLDVISEDAYYIRPPSLRRLWSICSKVADGLVFISEFSKDQYNRRFPEGAHLHQLACLCSLDRRDYESPAPSQPGRDGFVFVIGNHFEHKFVGPAVEQLHEAMPEREIVVLGAHHIDLPNVRVLRSGGLTEQELQALYWRAALVFFPSHYEGFGFPIPHALAKNKTVIARDGPLNRDIAAGWNGAGTLYLHETLPDMIRTACSLLQGEEPAPRPVPLGTAGCPAHDWNEVGRQIARFLTMVVKSDPRLEGARRRLEFLSGVDQDGELLGLPAEIANLRHMYGLVTSGPSFRLGRLLTSPARLIQRAIKR